MSSIRPNVLRMEPYSPGKPISEVQRELGLDRVIKLASNENPFGPSPKAVEAVREAAAQMHLYPDAGAFDLKQAIAQRFEIPAANIVLGNGSDELIHLLGLVFLDSPEDEVVVGDPSFVRYYAAAHLAPAKLVKVLLDEHYTHDLSAMAKAVTGKTKLVFIANPNNPTGTIVHRREVDAFLQDLPAHVVTVLDEAYFEFAKHVSDFPNSVDYVKAGRNVVGLRTFSKTYGLAGIRVGYGFASGEVIDAFERAREPFNVNSLAQVAAIAALDDDDHIRKTVENNKRGIEKMNTVLREFGADPCESYGNFVFADLKQDSGLIFEALLRKGIIIRAGKAFGTPTCVRVSIGTEEENEAFVEGFREVMTEKTAR